MITQAMPIPNLIQIHATNAAGERVGLVQREVPLNGRIAYDMVKETVKEFEERWKAAGAVEVTVHTMESDGFLFPATKTEEA